MYNCHITNKMTQNIKNFNGAYVFFCKFVVLSSIHNDIMIMINLMVLGDYGIIDIQKCFVGIFLFNKPEHFTLKLSNFMISTFQTTC